MTEMQARTAKFPHPLHFLLQVAFQDRASAERQSPLQFPRLTRIIYRIYPQTALSNGACTPVKPAIKALLIVFVMLFIVPLPTYAGTRLFNGCTVGLGEGANTLRQERRNWQLTLWRTPIRLIPFEKKKNNKNK